MAPEHSIARILNDREQPVGLAFAVAPRRLVSCAHVVNVALGRGKRDASNPGDVRVVAEFPFSGRGADRIQRRVRLERWLPAVESFDSTDVVLLTLLEDLPMGVVILPLCEEDPRGEVQMWGPTQNRQIGDVVVSGHVSGRLMGWIDRSRLQVDQELRGVFKVRPGFSGGPVWQPTTGAVVGLLHAAGSADTATDAYVLTAELIRELIADPMPTSAMAPVTAPRPEPVAVHPPPVTGSGRRTRAQFPEIRTPPSGASVPKLIGVVRSARPAVQAPAQIARHMPVALSFDAGLLAASDLGLLASLWNVRTAATPRRRADLVQPHRVTALGIAGEGGPLAVGCADGAVRLWDFATATVLETFKDHSGPVSAVVFSPTGDLLASCAEGDPKVFVRGVTFGGVGWHMSTATPTDGLERPNKVGVSAIAFSGDGGSLAGGSPEGTVRVWHVGNSGATSKQTLGGRAGPTDPVTGPVTSVAISRDGVLLAVGHRGAATRIWNLRSGTVLAALPGTDWGAGALVGFAADGSLVHVIGNAVELWSLDHSDAPARSAVVRHGDEAVDSIAVSADSAVLATAGGSGTVILWSLTGSEKWER